MTSDQLPTKMPPARASRMLTAAQFHQLADVPPEVSGSPISAIQAPGTPRKPPSRTSCPLILMTSASCFGRMLSVSFEMSHKLA